jgi:hypothetical protein
MGRDDFSVIYSGDSFQADLLKSLLDDRGIQAVLEDEFLGRMYPYAVGGVKVIVLNADLDQAREIVEKFLNRPDIRLVE